MLSNINPALGKVSDFALTAFGGTMRSEDPYAVDQAYIRYVFGCGPPAPCPRF